LKNLHQEARNGSMALRIKEEEQRKNFKLIKKIKFLEKELDSLKVKDLSVIMEKGIFMKNQSQNIKVVEYPKIFKPNISNKNSILGKDILLTPDFSLTADGSNHSSKNSLFSKKLLSINPVPSNTLISTNEFLKNLSEQDFLDLKNLNILCANCLKRKGELNSIEGKNEVKKKKMVNKKLQVNLIRNKFQRENDVNNDQNGIETAREITREILSEFQLSSRRQTTEIVGLSHELSQVKKNEKIWKKKFSQLKRKLLKQTNRLTSEVNRIRKENKIQFSAFCTKYRKMLKEIVLNHSRVNLKKLIFEGTK